MNFEAIDGQTEAYIKSALASYHANRNDEHMLNFLTHKCKKTINDNVTNYWDMSRQNDHMKIAIRYADNSVTMKLSDSQFLYFLGFRAYDAIWHMPINESKLRAFFIHMNLFHYKERTNCNIIMFSTVEYGP